MKRDDAVYLEHVLQSIAKIEGYLEGIDREAFCERSLLQDGVIRQIEIIGEAVKQLSTGLRDKYPHVAWVDIAGMRDKLIHHYFGVDLETVWLSATEDLPQLRGEIQQVLRDLAQGSD